MKYPNTKNSAKEHCPDDYLAAIPENVWDLLVPANPEEHADFCAKLNRLRIREVEREYVMDLQQMYRIPIRPNESVKATMIRVRLTILKERLENFEPGNRTSLFGGLPVDPLE